MIKKILKGALIGAAAFMVAAPAYALTEVNIFGASAEYTFWTDAAPKFLADAAGANCQGIVQHAKSTGITYGGFSARDAGVAQGFDCQGVGEEVVVSYTTFSSVRGIIAVQGSGLVGDACALGEAGVPDYDDQDNDSASVTWGLYPAAAGTVDDLVCKDVVVGASDVAGASFAQSSNGQLLGPRGGGFVSYSFTPVNTDGLDFCRPIVVPFSFFGDENLPIIPAGAQGNLTRLQATSIFSGSVTDWSDFGYAPQTITACLRHAGSGTHATLDAAIMRGDAALLKDEALPGSPAVLFGISPITYFNKGSSDLIKCIRDAGAGAIGYADSDKNGAAYDGSQGSYPTVQRLMYMGADGNADTIKNGIYDFWSAQWLYFSEDEDPVVKAKVVELCNFAADGANMPASKAAFWAAEGDMKVEKSDDFAWPTWK